MRTEDTVRDQHGVDVFMRRIHKEVDLMMKVDIAHSPPGMVVVDELKTGHWIADLHHTMILTVFSHAARVLGRGNHEASNSYLDAVTLLLYIHFLVEEEELKHAADLGWIAQAEAEQHEHEHARFIQLWENIVLEPFKRSSMEGRDLIQPLLWAFHQFMHQVDAADQPTFGHGSDLTPSNIRALTVHVANLGIPLSPCAEGAAERVAALRPRFSHFVDPTSLAPMPRLPLGMTGNNMRVLSHHREDMLVDLVRAVADDHPPDRAELATSTAPQCRGWLDLDP